MAMFAPPTLNFTEPPKDPADIPVWSDKSQKEMMVANAVMSVINSMYDMAKGWASQIAN
jgi:hypothetical protein